MAYACPVCEALVPDGEHLAHHLAIVATARGGEHETWLEATVPDWSERTPEALAADAVEHAETVEHDLVDDPRASDAHGHERPEVGHDHGRVDRSADPDREQPDDADGPPSTGGSIRDVEAPFGGAGGDLSPETADVLREARELTEQRRADADDGDARDGGGDAAEQADGTTDETDSDE